MKRVSRGAALALVPAVLGWCSVFATSSAPIGAATLRARTSAIAATSAPYPDGPKGRWQLVFSDHFTGTTLNTANWSTCYFWSCTDGGNNELEWYQASQVTLHNGTVSLTVIPERTNGKEYVSGMLSSHGKFSFRYLAARNGHHGELGAVAQCQSLRALQRDKRIRLRERSSADGL